MTTKVIPPASASSPIKVFDRTYNPALGAQDVPDHDAQILLANGWINAASGSPTGTVGTDSTARPIKPAKNATYIDNTLGIKEVFDGKVWRNALTGAIVP